MARPVKLRLICEMPKNREFVPSGCADSEYVEMTLDEYEAMRLIDYLGLSQEDCAAQMNVARTTVQYIYNAARRKIADALVCGKRLKICGGSYKLCQNNGKCCARHCRARSKNCMPCRGVGPACGACEKKQ